MKRYAALFLIVPLLLGCCLGRKSQEDRATVAHDSLSALTDFDEMPGDTADYGSEDGQDACVFDTSTFKFTTEKLKEYRADISYRWDRWHAEAQTVLADGDTLWLHIGGCDHFGYSASLGTAVSYTDSAALMNKARWVARTFLDDDRYDALIAKGQMEQVEGSIPGKVRRYNIIVPDSVSTVYEGFSFARKGTRTRVEIAYYIN